VQHEVCSEEKIYADSGNQFEAAQEVGDFMHVALTLTLLALLMALSMNW
jgi:hypothetical protein